MTHPREMRVGFIGEMILDRYRYGYPERISREAPVIILRSTEEKNLPGGGANTLNNLLDLGADVDVATIVGDDEAGRFLVEFFGDKGVKRGSFIETGDRRTTAKERLVARGNGIVTQQLLRYDVVTSDSFREGERELLLERIRRVLEDNDIIVVSDYGQFMFDPTVIDVINSYADRKKILVDSRKQIGDFIGHFFVTPNEEEAKGVSNLTGLEQGREVRSRTEARNVVITLGERGMLYVGEEGEEFVPRFGSGEAVDVSGAGDTVIAAIAVGSAMEMTPLEAVYFASVCAELVVNKPFTATVGIEEVKRAIEEKYG